MNTLRMKIAMLIVAAIVMVIGLVGWSVIVFTPIPAFERLVDINAYYLNIARVSVTNSSCEQIAEAVYGTKPGKFGLKSEPATGKLMVETTEHLRKSLHRHNIAANVVVTEIEGSFWPVVSVAIPDKGWLVMPVFIPPSPIKVLPFLFGWIVIGTAIVAIFVAFRFMSPLALIERAVKKIGPGGELPVLAEKGPADIRATARAINLLSSRLKNAMESRMRLVAAAGHDLRTPMTRMRLRAEFLDDADREKWLADLDELDHIADSAIRLVHEETQSSKGKAVRLDLVVGEVVAELQELQLKVHAMQIEQVYVTAQPLSMKRAIRNLLINAATHGEGATVTLRRSRCSVLIEIIDNGPGIPEDLLAQAFEPFFRVNSARSAKAGAGLGLAIAKEIVQSIKGRIVLANRVGGGLIQTIELPAALR